MDKRQKSPGADEEDNLGLFIAPKQTLEGCRKRFYRVLEDYLGDGGWVHKGSYLEKIEGD